MIPPNSVTVLVRVGGGWSRVWESRCTCLPSSSPPYRGSGVDGGYRGLRQRVWEWAWHRGSRWPISCQSFWPPPTTTRSTSPNIHIDLVALADRLPLFDPQPIVDKPEGTVLTNVQENSTLAGKKRHFQIKKPPPTSYSLITCSLLYVVSTLSSILVAKFVNLYLC